MGLVIAKILKMIGKLITFLFFDSEEDANNNSQEEDFEPGPILQFFTLVFKVFAWTVLLGTIGFTLWFITEMIPYF